jgi:hypothetical protein
MATLLLRAESVANLPVIMGVTIYGGVQGVNVAAVGDGAGAPRFTVKVIGATAEARAAGLNVGALLAGLPAAGEHY